jgi:hypothetical protein
MKEYVITAIDANGDTVFYASDSHSGGYPFWSSYNYKTFHIEPDVVKLFGTDSYMYNNIVKISVCEIQLNPVFEFSPHDAEKIMKMQAKAEIENKINELQKQLKELE